MDNGELFIDPDHPTLLGSCAHAAGASEARYRVGYPNSKPRASRIFALDPTAAEVMYRITEEPWNSAHFLTLATREPVDPEATAAAQLPLCHPDGSPAQLDAEIAGADIVVLLAADGYSEGAAEIIARECFNRNITCAGLALGAGQPGAAVDRVVNSMRRFARVLVVAQDEDYVAAMLTALRA